MTNKIASCMSTLSFHQLHSNLTMRLHDNWEFCDDDIEGSDAKILS